jgi:hypothetical protein
VAGCCTPGARSSWHISIRDRSKSGHLKRAEMIRSIQEILCLLYKLDCKKRAETGKSKGSCRLCRRTGIRSVAHRTLLACHSPPSSDVNATPLVQGDPPQLQTPKTFDPTLSCRKMPIRHHLHFAVHHDRSISVSFLDRQRGHEKLNKEAVTIKRRSRMTSDTTVSAHPKASGRLAPIPGYSRRPASQLPSVLAQSHRQILSRSKQCSERASHDPAASSQPRAAQSRGIRNVLWQEGNSPGS